MGFPNTAYQPGRKVWIINRKDEPVEDSVQTVLWSEERIEYELKGRTGRWDMDDLFPTRSSCQYAADAQKAANRDEIKRRLSERKEAHNG